MIYYGEDVIDKEKDNKRKKKEKGRFDEFIKKNEKRIEKLKNEFPKATKAGIQDLLFLIWLQEEDENSVFERARGLLKKLFKEGWIKGLRAFKLVPERIFGHK